MTLTRWFGLLAATFAFSICVAATAFSMSKPAIDSAAIRADAPVERLASRKCWWRNGRQVCSTRAAPRARQNSDYQQYWADKLPYGTSAWWDQMVRENRGGNSPGGGHH